MEPVGQETVEEVVSETPVAEEAVAETPVVESSEEEVAA